MAFTDGDDTASRRSMGDALERARDKETMIYAIGLESEFFVAPGRVQRTRPDRGLRKLADETGGGYFELKKTDELGPDLHARRPGAARAVHHRLHARR